MLHCVTLWIGEGFGAVERACLRSVLRQGHRLTLYCYREPIGIPDGVELQDASAILPETSIVRHRGGSVAPFSDWFRYELLKRGLGTWIDTDMYLLRPLDEEAEHLFGEERPGVINNAVLRLPPDSPTLDELLEPFRGTTPAWLSARHRAGSHLRKLLNGRVEVGAMPWGTTGPAALTAVAAKFGISSCALPAPVFYPVPWEQAAWILDPRLRLDEVVADETVGIHLWNECIKGFKSGPAPSGSLLEQLQQEGAP
jgi:Alpha 1,4-glycosyltransferase conserved region